MPESIRMWAEIIFDLGYLITIYYLVILMSARIGQNTDTSKSGLLKLFRNSFLLLAIGDTGHVGFRVVAYAMGGLNTMVMFGGESVKLVGIGAMATAFLVTILYMLFIEIWRKRFDKPRGVGYYLLMGVGIVRIILMCFPQNQWGALIAPYDWSLIRNIPLLVLGLSSGGLFLFSGIKEKDKSFIWIGIMIFISYGFYIPVILFSQEVPVLGFLMIPKTMAYIGAAIIGYRGLFMPKKSE